MQHVLKILRLKASSNFRKLRQPIDRNAWTFMQPTDVNAAYYPSHNDMSKCGIYSRFYSS